MATATETIIANIHESLAGHAVPIDSLTPDPANARKHNERNLAAIKASLEKFGQDQPLVVQKQGMVIRKGNGRWAAARALGWSHVAAIVVDESDVEATARAIADNRTAELAEWDNSALVEQLVALQNEPSIDELVTGFDGTEIDALISEMAGEGEPEEDEAPEVQEKAVSVTGDLWLMGEHRVLCGDSTKAEDVERATNGSTPGMILTDPPYCSGGFQEAGIARGTIHKMIHNDRLSTRGYQALLRLVLGNVRSDIVYIFTDWRMWIHLFDVVEASGCWVRSMIVWDKGSPALGRGWRAQHEIVMCGVRKTVPFSPHLAQGNVIQCQRTGNKNHPTEKPVPLLETILVVTDFAKTVYDPFLGSGSTLIAAQLADRACYGIELDPGYVDVIVKRWQNYTEDEATLETTGQAFAEVAAERGVELEKAVA